MRLHGRLKEAGLPRVAIVVTFAAVAFSATPPSAWGQNVTQDINGERNVGIGVVNGNVVIIYSEAGGHAPLNLKDGSVQVKSGQTVYPTDANVRISVGKIYENRAFVEVRVEGRSRVGKTLRETQELPFRYYSHEANYAVRLEEVVPEEHRARIKVRRLR